MSSARTLAADGPPMRQGELSSVELANLRLVGEARIVLIGVAVLVAFMQPAAPARSAVWLTFLLYAAFSIHALLRARNVADHRPLRVNHWIDLVCYLAAAAITGGLKSPFGVFLLFPVFTICLRRGLRVGLLVTLLCGTALALQLDTPLAAGPLLSELKLAPVVLVLAVAAVMARWAHAEITIVRRLAFCNDIARVFTARHELCRVVSDFADMLRSYQNCKACVVLLKDPRSSGWLLFESDGRSEAARGDPVEEHLAQPLLVIPGNRAVLYRRSRLAQRRVDCRVYDIGTLQPAEDVDQSTVEELAELLEGESLLSVPLQSRNQPIGRLHLTFNGLSYSRNDLEFLAYLAAQVGVMIENVQLVDRLAMEVATEERKKISRDLHDGTIQPYIGLKLALEALHRKVAGDLMLVHEVDDIIKMASDGISQLRHYVGHLKSTGQNARRNALLPAIRRQAGKFSEYYGIRTEVIADGDVAVRGMLFEEVMHLVREGLSNVRRHTSARSAEIHVHAGAGKLELRFTNDTSAPQCTTSEPFYPRSLSERARELGGRVDVDTRTAGRTVVSVIIPV